MNIYLKSMHIENFKGLSKADFNFSEKTIVKGANATGKTTIVDAFTWLLFDKNSQYATDFEIRPLDKDGNPVHMVDITVSAVIDFDGTEHELKKIQKENWVKQRGTETAVFKGNVNSFEIDGYPKSLAEYKAFIESMVAEDKFKIVTNPTYFPNLKWKEQRDTLIKFASVESDVEIAKRIGGFDEIIDELGKAPSTDDIQKKYKNAKKELENRLKELPVRVDEISKSKVDYDLAELELQKNVLEEKLNVTSESTNIEELKGELMNTDLTISEYTQKGQMENSQKRYAISSRISDATARMKIAESEKNTYLYGLETEKKMIESDKVAMEEMSKAYFTKKDETFDDSKWVYNPNSEYCEMCGQILPVSKIDSLKTEFEQRKAKAIETFNASKTYELQTLVERGNALKDKIAKAEKSIAEKESKAIEYNVAIESAKFEKETLEKELSELPKYVSYLDDEHYMSLCKIKNDLASKIKELEENAYKIAFEKNSIQIELNEVNAKLAQASNNSKIDERIEELKAEQREVSQKIADCEKVLFLVENFVKAKLNSISSMINSKFAFVNWKLFDVAINGGVSECCELTVNGVPYSDLNSACKTQAGLDIINTFSDTYNASCPVFVDNRESCTWIPEMKSQTISLYVDPSNKTLVVESEV